MNMDALVSLSKRRGFVFQSSEIYGGTGSVWDYGPLGVELKNNIKRVWWRDFVQVRADMVGIDASILMHPTVWKASGHLDHFTDPMVDCRECRRRFRADHVDAVAWTHYCPATKGNKFTIPAGEPCGHCGPRDRPGEFRNLRQRPAVDATEAAVRNRAGRSIVPQRDHAGQFHLPDAGVRADGDRVLRQPERSRRRPTGR